MNDPKKPSGWGSRHTLVLLGFWGMAAMYAMRFNVSLAIVDMVIDESIHRGNQSTETEFVSCRHLIEVKNVSALTENNLSSQFDSDSIRFHWTEREQGVIIGSFFYGYFLTQIPGGMLAQKYSAKWVLGIGVLISAIFTIASPIAALFGKEYFILCRFVEGLAGGTFVPSIQVILAKWLPPVERSRFVGWVFAGCSIGTAITMLVSGFLIQWFGWPMVFYAIGGYSILWFVIWSLLIYDTPESHPRVSPEEKHYILASLGQNTQKAQLPTPWRKIMSSPPVFIIIFSQTTKAWGLYTLLNLLPKYLNSVLHFDIKENSLSSAAPELCMFIFATTVTRFGDHLIESKRCSILTMRKACNTIAQFGSCFALLGAAYAGCDRISSVILLIFAVGLLGAGYGGCLVNVIDIAPNFAGVIMGIGNTFCSMTGFIGPAVAGAILTDNVTLERWRWVFFIAAGLLFIGNVFYLLFTETDEAEWNQPPPFNEDKLDKPKCNPLSNQLEKRC